MANKIRFGLSNVHYSVISENAQTHAITYATPVPWPGAVSLTLDTDAESNNVWADNNVWAVLDSMKGGSGTLEFVDVPDSVYTDLLNFSKLASGEIVENDTPVNAEFALLFEVSSNTNPIGFKYYRCALERPSISAATTEDSTEPATDSFNIKFMPMKNGGVKTVRSWLPITSTAERTSFYGSVSLPTIPTVG